jgi:hypothetical protein
VTWEVKILDVPAGRNTLALFMGRGGSKGERVAPGRMAILADYVFPLGLIILIWISGKAFIRKGSWEVDPSEVLGLLSKREKLVAGIGILLVIIGVILGK